MNRIVGKSRVRSQGKMFFYVKKLLVVYNKLTESIKWERSKHHLKKKKKRFGYGEVTAQSSTAGEWQSHS